jgi:hypothetical protein
MITSSLKRPLLAAAISFAIALPMLAQAPAARPARLPDGHPNLNGIWQAMNTANWDLQDHASSASPVVPTGAWMAEPGGPGVVEGGEIPYLPAAKAQKEKNAKDRMNLDPEVKCYLPGIPRANYMPYPFQIFQSDQALAFAYQYDGAFRNIYLKDPGPAPADSWMGQSYGKWEGDTLVIDVTGLDDRTWFDRAGDFHSDELHVVERFTPRGPDVLMYEATITDPKTFSRPWKISMPLYRHLEPNARLMEFKCVEFVEELMYGQYRKKQ